MKKGGFMQIRKIYPPCIERLFTAIEKAKRKERERQLLKLLFPDVKRKKKDMKEKDPATEIAKLIARKTSEEPEKRMAIMNRKHPRGAPANLYNGVKGATIVS